MRYRNTFQGHIMIGQHRLLEPNGEIYLDAQALTDREIRSLIYEKHWLEPVSDEPSDALLAAEASMSVHDAQKNRLALAREKAKHQYKQVEWNPFKEAEQYETEAGRSYVPPMIDGKTEYGNMEQGIEMDFTAVEDGNHGKLSSSQEVMEAGRGVYIPVEEPGVEAPKAPKSTVSKPASPSSAKSSAKSNSSKPSSKKK